jgi:hypothetical protein
VARCDSRPDEVELTMAVFRCSICYCLRAGHERDCEHHIVNRIFRKLHALMGRKS